MVIMMMMLVLTMMTAMTITNIAMYGADSERNYIPLQQAWENDSTLERMTNHRLLHAGQILLTTNTNTNTELHKYL